jgi:hypothetical protein
MRGAEAVYRLTFIDRVKIVAVCDVVPEKTDSALATLTKRGFPPADVYTGEEDWKKICERDESGSGDLNVQMNEFPEGHVKVPSWELFILHIAVHF